MREIKPPVPALILSLCVADIAVHSGLLLLHGSRLNSERLVKFLLVIAIIGAALLAQHKRIRGPSYQARGAPGVVDFAAMVLAVTLGSLPLTSGLLWASADLRAGELQTSVVLTIGVGFITSVVGGILAVELSPKSFQGLRQAIGRRKGSLT